PLKRQANCATITMMGLTTTVASAPGCTTNLAIPTGTVIGCGTCNLTGSRVGGFAQLLKSQASSNCTTVTVSVYATDTSIPGCTLTNIAPTVLATACGTC
ncbi:20656_t:CDS:1, partial [Gigaspora rosea]